MDTIEALLGRGIQDILWIGLGIFSSGYHWDLPWKGHKEYFADRIGDIFWWISLGPSLEKAYRIFSWWISLGPSLEGYKQDIFLVDRTGDIFLVDIIGAFLGRGNRYIPGG